MSLVDLIVLAVVLGGIGFMVYRTMWKKKTMCPGCEGGCGLSAGSSERPGSCCGSDSAGGSTPPAESR